jgi:hypothetical protein
VAIWQLTLTSDGRDALFPSEASRNTAVRALARTAAPHLALFSITDRDIHLVIESSTARAGRIARAVLLSLRSIGAEALEPARRRPVHDRDHLAWLTRHLLELPNEHALPCHPALWTGSALLDLVGARALGEAPLLLPELLPGFSAEGRLDSLGLVPGPLHPVSDRQLLLAGPGRLLHAAAAALAADPQLEGRGAPVVAARQAVAQLGERAGLPTRTLADTLGMTTQGVRRLQLLDAHHDAQQAVRRYLALEERVIQRALAAS